MQKLAQFRGGRCLSDDYQGSHTKLKWECSAKHVWEATPNLIQQRRWCPICGRARELKYTLQDMQDWAAKKNGECLAVSYDGIKKKVKWKCDRQHTWAASFDNIIHENSWCPYCSHKASRTITEMREIAASRGGECLSVEIVNVNTYLKWECGEGHMWSAAPSSVIGGSWCPNCIGRHKTIEDMQEEAEEHGGQCLSPKYIAWNHHLEWRCSEGHKWKATPNNVLMGYWCRICGHNNAGLKRRFTIEDVHEVAKQKGGKCLSTEYKGVQEHLRWECKKGHTWKATFDNVKHGTWCPSCCERRHEKLCREIFEEIFQKSFVKTRSALKGRLELDGYCNELKIAFEYNGQQHYKRHPLWHRSPDALEKQQTRDRLKARLCEERGINLIIIPYTENHRLKEFILEELARPPVL